MSKWRPSWQRLNVGRVGIIVPLQFLMKLPLKFKIYGKIKFPEYCTLLLHIRTKQLLNNCSEQQKSTFFNSHLINPHSLFGVLKDFFEMEGARYSRLTYFLCERNIIWGPWGTDVSEDVLRRCSHLSTPLWTGRQFILSRRGLCVLDLLFPKWAQLQWHWNA